MHIYNSLGDDHSTPASSTPSEPVKVSQGNKSIFVIIIIILNIVYDPEQVKKVLKKHLADLSDLLAVHMSVIGIRLYSEELIPKTTYESTITSSMAGRDKANSLLLTLKATINAQPQLMKTLIEVLKKSKVSEAVAAKMEQDVSTTDAINWYNVKMGPLMLAIIYTCIVVYIPYIPYIPGTYTPYLHIHVHLTHSCTLLILLESLSRGCNLCASLV